MASVAVPASAASGRALRTLRRLAGNVASVAAAAVRPHKASVARLADMPLAVLGTGGIDFSAFHVNHGVGWLVLGVSLWVVEHLIADDTAAP